MHHIQAFVSSSSVTIDLRVRFSQLSAATMRQRSFTPAGTRSPIPPLPPLICSVSPNRDRCVTCVVADHPPNGVLISRIVGLVDRLRALKLSKVSRVFAVGSKMPQLISMQDPEVSCEARCAEDLIARLSDGQMKADGALLLSNLS